MIRSHLPTKSVSNVLTHPGPLLNKEEILWVEFITFPKHCAINLNFVARSKGPWVWVVTSLDIFWHILTYFDCSWSGSRFVIESFFFIELVCNLIDKDPWSSVFQVWIRLCSAKPSRQALSLRVRSRCCCASLNGYDSARDTIS